MSGVNKVIVLGFLGIDPEVRTLESGAKLARLRIATSEAYTAKDGQRIEQTEWHNVVVWRGLADVAEKYLTKGKQVYIEGKLKTRSWKDQEGNDRYTTEIVADNMQLLGRSGGGERPQEAQNSGGQSTQQQPQTQPQSAAPAGDSGNDEDDLPF
ncbi:MAG: single-stranded DNA-binding protein [Cryomorphaceae bacterium]|nr:single-stranded DNA-binding protein [Flavobacteriales bacterium]